MFFFGSDLDLLVLLVDETEREPVGLEFIIIVSNAFCPIGFEVWTFFLNSPDILFCLDTGGFALVAGFEAFVEMAFLGAVTTADLSSSPIFFWLARIYPGGMFSFPPILPTTSMLSVDSWMRLDACCS